MNDYEIRQLMLDAIRTYYKADVMLTLNKPMTIKQAYEFVSNQCRP